MKPRARAHTHRSRLITRGLNVGPARSSFIKLITYPRVAPEAPIYGVFFFFLFLLLLGLVFVDGDCSCQRLTPRPVSISFVRSGRYACIYIYVRTRIIYFFILLVRRIIAYRTYCLRVSSSYAYAYKIKY